MQRGIGILWIFGRTFTRLSFSSGEQPNANHRGLRSAEIACAIICGCLSPLPVFLRFLKGKSPLSQSSTAVGSGGSKSMPRVQMRMGSGKKGESWEELTEV